MQTLIEALSRRQQLLAQLHAEDTDCYRLLHGIAEGRPGLTIDRYGPVLLVQTWRAPLEPNELAQISSVVSSALGTHLTTVWHHRGGGRPAGGPLARGGRQGDGRPADVAPAGGTGGGDVRHSEVPASPVTRAGDDTGSVIGHELGQRYDVRPNHRGQDPLLFLDLRAGRRRILSASPDRTVLNLFAYTCGIGVCAAAGGAREVWNVDFARSSLAVGRTNANLNGITDGFVTVRQDVIPVLRQLAGLSVRGRGARRRQYRRFEPRQFDIVVLDPPRWATSAFGAVDVVRDYPSLFKPAVMATTPGGYVLATNHVPSVPLEDWLGVLERCAAKAGRPLSAVEVIAPETDFPSFDNEPPLKMVWAQIGP